jgi:hypothetical protein
MKPKWEGKDVRFELPEWLAERTGLPIRNEGFVVKETKKAVLLRIEDKDELWLPIKEMVIREK